MVNVNILIYAEILNGLVLMAYIVVRYSPLYYGLLLIIIIIIIIMLHPLAEMESARVCIVCMVVVCRRVVLSACKPGNHAESHAILLPQL